MLELKQLVTLVVPNFYGSPVAPLHYWGVGNYSEQTIYTGAVALILALAAPVVHKKFFTG